MRPPGYHIVYPVYPVLTGPGGLHGLNSGSRFASKRRYFKSKINVLEGEEEGDALENVLFKIVRKSPSGVLCIVNSWIQRYLKNQLHFALRLVSVRQSAYLHVGFLVILIANSSMKSSNCYNCQSRKEI